MLRRNELIDVVASDLRFLREEWDESIDDHSLRRSSTVLRRLLVENELQRAWKAAEFEKEPKIKTSSLDAILKTAHRQNLVLASAGGARFQGMEMRGILVVNYAMSDDEIKMNNDEELPEEVIGLRIFVDKPCMIIQGIDIPRRTLIKFVANKLGGAHYDPKRRNFGEERLFKLLDWAGQEFKFAEKNSVYFEILSIGQALITSEDINKFCEKAEKHTVS